MERSSIHPKAIHPKAIHQFITWLTIVNQTLTFPLFLSFPLGLFMARFCGHRKKHRSLLSLFEWFLSEVYHLCTNFNWTLKGRSWVQCMCICTYSCYLYETSMELHEQLILGYTHHFCFVHWFKQCCSNDWMQSCHKTLKTHWQTCTFC